MSSMELSSTKLLGVNANPYKVTWGPPSANLDLNPDTGTDPGSDSDPDTDPGSGSDPHPKCKRQPKPSNLSKGIIRA